MYQNLSEVEKDRWQKKARERHQNLCRRRKRKKASVLSGTQAEAT